MKKYLFTCLAVFSIAKALGQNGVSGTIALYGLQYAAATTITNGGNILVSTGGNWVFGGNIISADKGGANAPTTTGRSETIVFDAGGDFTANGFIIDGYAGTTAAQTTSLVLPIGNSTTAYPVTIPVGNFFTAAYFDGSGITQNTMVNGQTSNTIEYSPYIDVPNGLAGGRYTFSYPGFPGGANSSLLSSNNSSASGTGSSTTYTLLARVPTFSTTPDFVTASLPDLMATQIYFASSNTVLPVSFVNFESTTSGCTANLVWKTGVELNSSYYAVELSVTGNIFAEVAKVNSKNSAAGASYTYSYSQLNGGNNFFRLKAVDLNGKYIYSPIIRVTGNGPCSAGSGITASPNPAINMVNIQHLDGRKNLLVLFDMDGKKLTEVNTTGTSQSINISMYASGVYLLCIQNASGGVSFVKIVKQ